MNQVMAANDRTRNVMGYWNLKNHVQKPDKSVKEKVYNEKNGFHSNSAQVSCQHKINMNFLSQAKQVKIKTAYQTYESENYRLVPDNDAKCLDIYNKQGEHLGAFLFSDLNIKQDSATGTQLLISEYGTMSFYNALLLDDELKQDLQNFIGKDTLEQEELQGYTLKKHSDTGIFYLVRDGEEGRGGRILFQGEEDEKKYETLANTYLSQYSNLIHTKEEASFWASAEIRGLAERTNQGILLIHFQGISYMDNKSDKNNWNVRFSESFYRKLLEGNYHFRKQKEEMQKFSFWQELFEKMEEPYERIYTKEEEEQGDFNH